MNGTPKLVAFDVDGTLVGSSLSLRPRVLEAVAKMRARGVAGCLVTGRMYRSVLPYAREMRLDAPIVCYQGAAIVDPTTDAVLFDSPLPNAQALDLVEYAHAERVHVQLYANDRFYCESLDRFAELYASISGVEPMLVPSLKEAFAQSDSTKAVLVSDPQTIAKHLPRVKALLGGSAYVTRSIPNFLEVMNANVDKGKSLGIVAERLGVEMTDVMAIGDSWNDAPLLRAAGFGVAMGSAPDELKDLADAVVADVETDGVAEALERFVLRES
jgi:hypothetical protein